MFQTLTMVRANDFTFTGAVTLNGAALNLTGSGMWMTAKYSYGDPDASAVFQIKSASLGGSDITYTDAANGLISVTVPKTATSTVPWNVTNLVYDLKLIQSGGALRTLATGTLIVLPEVTRATA